MNSPIIVKRGEAPKWPVRLVRTSIDDPIISLADYDIKIKLKAVKTMAVPHDSVPEAAPVIKTNMIDNENGFWIGLSDENWQNLPLGLYGFDIAFEPKINGVPPIISRAIYFKIVSSFSGKK